MNPPFRGISTLYRKVCFREVAVVKVATELNTLTVVIEVQLTAV